MKTEKKIRAGLWRLLAACICFCNPTVAFVDVLPDFIGCLLLVGGLEPFAGLNSASEDAQKKFRALFWVELAQIPVCFLLYAFRTDGGEDLNERTLILLASFVLALFRVWFLFPALRRTFTGLSQLSDRYGGSDKRFSRLAGGAVLPGIVAPVCALLPEFAALTTTDAKNGFLPFDWYEYIGLFRVTMGLISGVCAVVFLVMAIRAVSAALRDAALIGGLAGAAEALPEDNPAGKRGKRFRLSVILIGIGFLFTANIRLNYQALLPDSFAAFSLAAGLFLLPVPQRAKAAAYPTFGALFAAGIVQILLNRAYLKAYEDPVLSLHFPKEYQSFLRVRISETAEAAIACLAVILTFVCLLRLLRNPDFSSGIKKQCRGVKIRLCAAASLLTLSAAGSAVDAVLQLRIPWLWWIPLLLNLAGIAVYCSAADPLTEVLAGLPDE